MGRLRAVIWGAAAVVMLGGVLDRSIAETYGSAETVVPDERSPKPAYWYVLTAKIVKDRRTLAFAQKKLKTDKYDPEANNLLEDKRDVEKAEQSLRNDQRALDNLNRALSGAAQP